MKFSSPLLFVFLVSTRVSLIGITMNGPHFFFFFYGFVLITPHAQRKRGKVIDCGVHIYIYIYICIYVCGRKKYLNRTLEIDSPFQTLTVGLLVEFID